MNTHSTTFRGTIISSVIFALAGCSGGASTSTSTLPVAAAAPQSHNRSMQVAHETGVAPRFLQLMHFGKSHILPAGKIGQTNDVYVSDFGTGAVEILNPRFSPIGSIVSGLDGPDGLAFDAQKNLSVANYAGATVTQYAPGQTQPSFTYSAGLSDPIRTLPPCWKWYIPCPPWPRWPSLPYPGPCIPCLFVVDYNGGNDGFVDVYGPGSNSIYYQYAIMGAPEGADADSNGNLFVSYNDPNTQTGGVEEFPAGKPPGEDTGIRLAFAGDLIVDKSNNLIVADQINGTVNVYQPGTTTPSRQFGGFTDPFHLALGKKGQELLVADPAAGNVQVLTYPTGKVRATLGSGNGLSDPAGVAVVP